MVAIKVYVIEGAYLGSPSYQHHSEDSTKESIICGCRRGYREPWSQRLVDGPWWTFSDVMCLILRQRFCWGHEAIWHIWRIHLFQWSKTTIIFKRLLRVAQEPTRGQPMGSCFLADGGWFRAKLLEMGRDPLFNRPWDWVTPLPNHGTLQQIVLRSRASRATLLG